MSFHAGQGLGGERVDGGIGGIKGRDGWLRTGR